MSEVSEKIDPQKCIGSKSALNDTPYSWKDAATYALGIGFSQDPYEEKDLRYTYELHEDFGAIPTISSIWCTFNPFEIIIDTPGFPHFNAMSMLHGEHKTDSLKPLDVNKKYLNQAVIDDVADKGKGALVSFLIKTYEKNEDGTPGDVCLINTLSLFIRGLGGFGYKGKNLDQIPDLPSVKPTKVLVQRTIPNQAFIYRLSGDFNPLHVDKGMAEVGGFDKPILHGLCTYGIAAKLIIQNYCDNDATKFKTIKARFTSHVFPGETLVFLTWYVGNGEIIFEASTEERKKQVIVGFARIEPPQKL